MFIPGGQSSAEIMNLSIYYVFVLFSYNVISYVDGYSNRNYDRHHFIRTRQAGYQMCLETFDIFEDKIIRTQDSREMGAKYISERDVPSREECYQLCCDTEKCDVFVFEEKRPGSCYLFECGPPDDFKCKFTKHRNYTSGVSKHLSELETQIKFTQHEHELNNLREPEKKENKEQIILVPRTTTQPPGSKETLQLVPQETKHVEKPTKRCSRYQFECHTSHECIAVYNACDGIPQCADGSDEAPELDCPNQVTRDPPKSSSPTHSPVVENVIKPKGQEEKTSSTPESKNQMEKPVQQQQYGSHETLISPAPSEKNGETEGQAANVNTYQQNTNPQRQAPMSSGARLSYGREGEGMPYRNNGDNQWVLNDRTYHQNPGNGQIFSHKGNGIMAQNERFPQPHSYQDNAAGNAGYNSEQPNEYNRFNYYDNPQYRMGPSNQYGNAAWQGIHKSNELGPFPGEENMMKGERYPGGGMMPQEYYYDENSYRNRQQQMIDGRQQAMNSQQTGGQTAQAQLPSKQQLNRLQPPTAYENKAHLELTSLAKSKHEEQQQLKNIVPIVTTTVAAVTTIKSKVVKDEHHHQLTHVKFEKLTSDSAFAPNDIDGHNTSPSGAILSLTFGLLITALLVVLVGCRIRTVRRRLRRGGKAFAHDADFLVNGMYL